MAQPALAAGTGPRRLLTLREAGRSQAEGAVEVLQIVGDVRIVVGIDDGDGLAGPGAADGAAGKRHLIEAVGMGNLGRRENRENITVLQFLQSEADTRPSVEGGAPGDAEQ